MEVSLADVTRLITDGKHGDCVDEFNSGYYFISCKDVRDGKINYDDARQITRADYEDTHRRTRLEPNDILITNSGTIGRMAIASEAELTRRTTFQKSVAIVKPNRNVIEPKFLYYTLQAQVSYLVEISGGTAQKNLLLGDLRRFKLMLPHIDGQRKIAAILSSYDELIENNQRRIALLEKMAEEIYREWFVRLRFPGHEKVKKVKGVPEGWDILPFSEIVNINPSERIDKSDKVPFVGMEDLSLNSMFFAVKEHRKGASGSKFRNYDVLFPRITPSVENGKRGVVMTLADGQVGCGSTEFIVMREKVIGLEHIYFLTCSPEFRKHAELSMTGASGRQRVQEECFSFFLVKVPPPDVRQQFSELVRIHFSQIHLLSNQIENLKKTRDLLLPRLISGKLSVEHLDIQFPPGMEESACD